jgi:hypothetical protein
VSDVRLHTREITIRQGENGFEIAAEYYITAEASQLVLGLGTLKGVESPECTQATQDLLDAVNRALNKAAGFGESTDDARAL